MTLRDNFDKWAIKYIAESNTKEKKELDKKKEKITKELHALTKKLRKKRRRNEAKYIEKTIIPYVERTAHYPQSYRGCVEVFKELLI